MPYEGVVATSPSSQRYVANCARLAGPSFGKEATIRTERSLRAGQETTSEFRTQSCCSWADRDIQVDAGGGPVLSSARAEKSERFGCKNPQLRLPWAAAMSSFATPVRTHHLTALATTTRR